MDFYIIAIVLLTIISIISFLFFRYISAVERGVSIVKKDVENLKQLIIEFKREKAPIMVTPQMKQNLEQIHKYTKPQENLEEIQLGKQPTPEQHEPVEPVQQPTQEAPETTQIQPVQQPTQEAQEQPTQEAPEQHDDDQQDDGIDAEVLEELDELEELIEEQNDGASNNAVEGVEITNNAVVEVENEDNTAEVSEEKIRNMKVAELRKLAEDWDVENAMDIKKPELKEMLIQKLSDNN